LRKLAFADPFTSGAFVGDGTVMMPLDLRQALERSAKDQLAARHAEHAGKLPGSSTDLLTGATGSASSNTRRTRRRI
jgi:hypothetical protein